MKFIFEYKSNYAPKTYFSFTLIDVKLINTFQVISLNLVLFNFLFKIMHTKTPNTFKFGVWFNYFCVYLEDIFCKHEYVISWIDYQDGSLDKKCKKCGKIITEQL